MLMVLTVHADGASLGLPDLYGDVGSASSYDLWRLGIESVAIVGVNCFTIISGYFGLRLRWRNVAAFLFECVFYAVGIYTAVSLVFPETFSWQGWINSWLVLSHTDLWYVPAYFGLMLLSPLINAGMAAMDRGRATAVLAVFVLFNVWCGWWWHGTFNPTGYTLVQLILVYMIGRYIHLHIDSRMMRQRRGVIAAVYIASTAGIMVSSIYIGTQQAFAYNSPLVLASTISLFMLFATLNIQSRAINYAAQSAFAVYLIHKAPLVWGNVMRPGMIRLGTALTGWQLFLAGCGIVAGFYVIAMIIDPMRRALSRALLGK